MHASLWFASYTCTVFIRIPVVAAATINFNLAWVRLLIEGGSYSRAVFINFGPILDAVIHKICSIEGWFSKTALRVIEKRSSKKLPRCSKTKPRPSSVTVCPEQASVLYLWSWPHPLNRVCACVRLLFEGRYYFFRWAPGAATIWGRLLTCVCAQSVCVYMWVCMYNVCTMCIYWPCIQAWVWV